jgi:hypothetical protein
LRRAGTRRLWPFPWSGEIADGGFLARVLSEKQESDEHSGHDGKKPGGDLGRKRLKGGHITPTLAMLVKVDGLLPE